MDTMTTNSANGIESHTPYIPRNSGKTRMNIVIKIISLEAVIQVAMRICAMD